MVNSSNDILKLEKYLVVFVDLLGQGDGLRAITGLPKNEEERTEFTKQIHETFGKVLKVRKSFYDFFQANDAYVPDFNCVSPELHDEIIRLRKSEVFFQVFSDSIIIRVPLDDSINDENCKAMSGVFDALGATGLMGLFALSEKIPLRAGLDVGLGAMIDENDIYGPVLERAHYSESQLAEYPRFLIGEGLERFLLQVSEQKYKAVQGKVAKGLAKRCLEAIVKDTDGRLILDYLGEGFKGFSDNPLTGSLVDSALDFVTSEYKKFSEAKNHKLSARYFRLMQYIKERRGLWVTS